MVNTLPMLVSEAWPGDPGDEMFSSLTKLYETGHDKRASLEIFAAVLFYATIYDVFTQRFTVMASDIENERSRAAKVADDLAAVRGLLALSPTMAIQELNRLRQTLTLPQLTQSQDSALSRRRA